MFRRRLLLAVGMLSLIALAAGPALAASRAPLGREFTLKVGESATIRGEGLTVAFTGVPSDSRCPTTVVCVWEGNAEVAIALSKPPHDPATAVLNTHPSFAQNTIYQNYDIRLVRLDPYPRTERPIPQSRYRATFVVTQPDVTN